MTGSAHIPIDAETVNRVLKKIASDDVVIFSKDEAEALQSIAQFWLGWKSVGRFASGLKTVLSYIGWFILAWAAFKAGLIDWLKGSLK